MSAPPPETFARTDRAEDNGARLQLKVGGMHCSLCTSSIHKGLLRLDGAEGARVNIAHEKALIQYDPTSAPEFLRRKASARGGGLQSGRSSWRDSDKREGWVDRWAKFPCWGWPSVWGFWVS